MKRNQKTIQIKRATQAEILRESRHPFAQATRKHKSERKYNRNREIKGLTNQEL